MLPSWISFVCAPEWVVMFVFWTRPLCNRIDPYQLQGYSLSFKAIWMSKWWVVGGGSIARTYDWFGMLPPNFFAGFATSFFPLKFHPSRQISPFLFFSFSRAFSIRPSALSSRQPPPAQQTKLKAQAKLKLAANININIASFLVSPSPMERPFITWCTDRIW